MKFYLDTEFAEGATLQHNFLGFAWGPRVPLVQLISLALVDENRRTYYALNADCNLGAIWNSNEWVRDNVLRTIWQEHYPAASAQVLKPFTLSVVQELFQRLGRTRAQIAADVFAFVYPLDELQRQLRTANGMLTADQIRLFEAADVGDDRAARAMALQELMTAGQLECPLFYGWYCAYDWVLFCQLWGSMLNRPLGFPKHCYDLKQEMDAIGMSKEEKRAMLPEPEGHHALSDAKWNRLFHRRLLSYSRSALCRR